MDNTLANSMVNTSGQVIPNSGSRQKSIYAGKPAKQVVGLENTETGRCTFNRNEVESILKRRGLSDSETIKPIS
jgi:hypothetical protein